MVRPNMKRSNGEDEGDGGDGGKKKQRRVEPGSGEDQKGKHCTINDLAECQVHLPTGIFGSVLVF